MYYCSSLSISRIRNSSHSNRMDNTVHVPQGWRKFIWFLSNYSPKWLEPYKCATQYYIGDYINDIMLTGFKKKLEAQVRQTCSSSGICTLQRFNIMPQKVFSHLIVCGVLCHPLKIEKKILHLRSSKERHTMSGSHFQILETAYSTLRKEYSDLLTERQGWLQASTGAQRRNNPSVVLGCDSNSFGPWDN